MNLLVQSGKTLVTTRWMVIHVPVHIFRNACTSVGLSRCLRHYGDRALLTSMSLPLMSLILYPLMHRLLILLRHTLTRLLNGYQARESLLLEPVPQNTD